MDFKLTLDNFSGPLDLLLYLIAKAQIDIKDIFISKITEQYIEIVKNSSFNMDSAGEFLALSARLIEIKTKSLLSFNEEDSLELEEEKSALISQIEEYKKFKSISEQLFKNWNIYSKRLTKLPEEIEIPPPEKILIKNEVIDLINAITNISLRNAIKHNKASITTKLKDNAIEKVSIADGMNDILINVSSSKKMFLNSLLRKYSYDKEYIVTYFSATLELIKAGKVNAEQENIFSDILIYERNNYGKI